MISYLIIYSRKNTIKIDRSYIWLYLLFSLLMGCSLLLNGEFEEFEFAKKFLAYNLVAVVSFLAVDKFITSRARLNYLIITLLIIILINNIITYLQFNGNIFGWAIGYLFGDIDKSVDKIGDKESLLGASITPGIFGEVVKSAYYIAIITPLCFCFFSKQYSFIYKLFACVVICSSLVAVFMTQQRAAFAIIILTLISYLFLLFKRHPLVISCVSIIALGWVIFYLNSGSEVEMGRLNVTSDNLREKLVTTAITFISDHPVLGGPVSFLKITKLPAHNIVLDAYINAGISGFIIMMILFIKTTWKSASLMLSNMSRKDRDLLIMFTALSIINCMLYGLFHTTSYLSGEVIIFILLSIVLKASLLRNRRCTIITHNSNKSNKIAKE